jgi:hypothetical protein
VDGRWGLRNGWMGGWVVYEAYEVKKGKITLSFTSPEKGFFFYIYEGFTIHYSQTYTHTYIDTYIHTHTHTNIHTHISLGEGF